MFPRVIEVPDIMPLITSLGEIYGFADSKGDLYFDDVNQYSFFIQRHARAKFQAFLTIFSAYLTIFLLCQKIFSSKKSKISASKCRKCRNEYGIGRKCQRAITLNYKLYLTRMKEHGRGLCHTEITDDTDIFANTNCTNLTNYKSSSI